jgi:puromycin-sensitive aminopeptidase
VDAYRLPRTVVPSRYDLRLDPDLVTLTFTGEATIAVTVTEPVREIVLNAAELAITDVLVAANGGRTITGRATLEPEHERARLALDETMSPGEWRLQLRWTGILNDKLRGFYRSTYKDPAGATHTLAATQFEATDARRAFPCWDEPDFKAVFAPTLAIDPALSAVSNTRVVEERRDGGKKILKFADSMKMSTYLVAFIVGELEASEPLMVGRTAVRVWSIPGKVRLTGFGREIAAYSLGWFEQYYGVPYPGDKLDLLAIPDFAAGAMENLGAITYRETALLVDERQATHAELERIADVVAHENAHMWFGDLVTMKWWNGIWLNEAFATFLEMLAVDAWKPQWRRWTTFGVSRASAMSTDGLWSTRPIEFPVTAPREADAMFDVLTYEKGASVLRMLEQYLGGDVFRDGVREYLRRHAYANADTGDLWAALGHASGEPIPDVMDSWIYRAGYPLVTARLDGDAVALSQQRFTYLPSPPDPAVATPADTRWHVPAQIGFQTADARTVSRVIVRDGEVRVAIPSPGAAVVVNEGGHGFYRVRYAPELLERLVAWLDRLQPIERFNLVNDAWATTAAGVGSMADFLDLTARFREERDRNVWSAILGAFGMLNRIVSDEDRPRLQALIRDRLAPVVAALGWSPRAGEDELTRQLRGDVLRAFGILGNDVETQRQAAALYERARTDPASVDQNVFPALIAIVAHAGDTARYEEFLARFRAATTPQEEQRYLYALTAFRPPHLVQETLERTVNGEIRTQDAPFVARSLLAQVHARELAWGFVKERWEAMDQRYPKHGLRRMVEGLTSLATPALEQDVHRFFRERKIDLGGKTLAQYLEQLRIAVTLREREGAALSRYLARFS